MVCLTDGRGLRSARRCSVAVAIPVPTPPTSARCSRRQRAVRLPGFAVSTNAGCRRGRRPSLAEPGEEVRDRQRHVRGSSEAPRHGVRRRRVPRRRLRTTRKRAPTGAAHAADPLLPPVRRDRFPGQCSRRSVRARVPLPPDESRRRSGRRLRSPAPAQRPSEMLATKAKPGLSGSERTAGRTREIMREGGSSRRRRNPISGNPGSGAPSRARSVASFIYSRPNQLSGVPANPGNTRSLRPAPMCLDTTSENTVRKSVVSARSRPS